MSLSFVITVYKILSPISAPTRISELQASINYITIHQADQVRNDAILDLAQQLFIPSQHSVIDAVPSLPSLWYLSNLFISLSQPSVTLLTSNVVSDNSKSTYLC